MLEQENIFLSAERGGGGWSVASVRATPPPSSSSLRRSRTKIGRAILSVAADTDTLLGEFGAAANVAVVVVVVVEMRKRGATTRNRAPATKVQFQSGSGC